MTDLDRVAQPAAALGLGPGAALQSMIVMLGECRGRGAVPRQHSEEPGEPLGIEAEARWELPQKRPEFLFEAENPGGEEIGERGFDIAQLLHMSDEPAALDREDKILGRLVTPASKGFGSLQRIMRAVDLDRIEMPAGIGELVALAQPFRIEAAAPSGIAPAGDADADSAHPTAGAAACGAAAHRAASPRHGKMRAC
jgi:hypothetical protein